MLCSATAGLLGCASHMSIVLFDWIKAVDPSKSESESTTGRKVTGSPSFLLAQAIFDPNIFPYKYSNILKPSHSSYPSTYEDEQTECSETLAHEIQAPENYPEKAYRIHITFILSLVHCEQQHIN